MLKHHWLHVRTGKYPLTENVHFEITGNDAGVSITLQDVDRNVSYWVYVRDGRVNLGDIITARAKGDGSEARTVSGRFKSELGPTGYLPATSVGFTVNFPGTPLAPRRLGVLGGYQRRQDVRVIYREVAAGVFMDRIAKFRLPDEIVLNMRRGPTCLLPSDWVKFGAVPCGGKFKLGGRQQWEKLSLERLTELLNGKTFNSKL